MIAGKASYQQVLTAAAQPEAILFLPRLLLWYGADFGRDMPTRLARLITMVPRPSDLTGEIPRSPDLTGELTGGGNDKQYYAHACLSGFLKRYQQEQQQQQQQQQQPPQSFPLSMTDSHIDYNLYNWTVNDMSSS